MSHCHPNSQEFFLLPCGLIKETLSHLKSLKTCIYVLYRYVINICICMSLIMDVCIHYVYACLCNEGSLKDIL